MSSSPMKSSGMNSVQIQLARVAQFKDSISLRIPDVAEYGEPL